jgi:heme/copper-type cytochrome/quinol oxidase subunit 2
MSEEREQIRVKQVKTASVETNDVLELDWKKRLLSVDHWLRFVFMILFVIIVVMVAYVMVVLVLLQFAWALFSGEGNNKLRVFGARLSLYVYQALCFLTYNTEEKPFPFSDLPEVEKEG